MFVPFDQLPDHSRIWIYQSDRRLSDEEKNALAGALKDFCSQWAAHGQPLRSGFTIEHNQFVIIGADEDYQLPSGCSIDGSVRVLKAAQGDLGVNFFDRMNIAFLLGNEIVMHPMTRLKALFESGVLGRASMTFDNLVASKGDFTRKWKTSAEKTWLVKYLPDSALHHSA